MKLNTQPRNLCGGYDITITTINYNCASCHKQMTPAARQPGPTAIVAQPQGMPKFPVAGNPGLPNVTPKQPRPVPVAQVPKLPTPPMPVGYQPRLQEPTPVVKAPPRQPVLKPGLPQVAQLPVGQMPLLPGTPQYLYGVPARNVVLFQPPLPPLSQPTDLSMFTEGSTLAKMPARKGNFNAVPVPVVDSTRPLPEVQMAVTAPQPQPVLTKELGQPAEPPVPVTAQPLVAASSGRLYLGDVAAREDGQPAARVVVPPPLSEDELERPVLPALPRSVWLPPAQVVDTIEDFDRLAPAFATDRAVTPPTLPRPTPNTARAPLSQPLDAPALPALPSSVRSAS
jgi:hypothetical protein